MNILMCFLLLFVNAPIAGWISLQLPVVPSLLPSSHPAQATQPPPITADDIEHFLTLAFGDYAMQGKRRLISWRDSAAVQLHEVPDGDRKVVLEVMSEINQIAGRTMYYLSETPGNVEVNIVAPEAYDVQVFRTLRRSTSTVQSMKIGRTGHIESVRIFVRKSLPEEARHAAVRVMFTKVLGMMYIAMDDNRSILHGTKPSRRFEERDKVAIRLISEYANDAGITGDGMRKQLMAKYVTATAR